jgi:hypothetical protein
VGRFERRTGLYSKIVSVTVSGASALLALVIVACGSATAGAASPTASAYASPSVAVPVVPTGAGICSANAPVPGCQELGDPTAPASCHTTQGVNLSVPRSPEDKLPSYGYGTGPVYLSGQLQWYAGGEEALFLIDSAYTGTVRITGHLAGDAAAVPTFTGPTVSGSELDIPADSNPPYWRFWDGQTSFSKPGCYTLNLQSHSVDPITIYVHPGPPPPG